MFHNDFIISKNFFTSSVSVFTQTPVQCPLGYGRFVGYLQVRKLADSKVSVKEKRNLLKDPQVGKGIFSLIAGVLPLLISALTPK